MASSSRIEAKVTIDTSGFRAYAHKTDRAVEGAVTASLQHGAHVAAAAAPKDTGEMAAEIHATRVRRTARGYEGDILGRRFYTLFQDLGTKGRRRKKLKGSTAEQHKARRASLGRSGIKPHRFLGKGLREAKRVWAGNVRSRLL
jgi:hypothetical protein